MAGGSFVAAHDHLYARIDDDLRQRLRLAYREEVKHAAQVHDILKALGHKRKSELLQVLFWLNRTLHQVLAAFPKEHQPHLRMLLNLLLETKLCQVGIGETWEMIQIIADRTGNEALRGAGRVFYETVKAEEPSHLDLDEEVLHIYTLMHPQVERDAAFKALRSHGTPFRRAIRAKREFVRAASAVAPSSSG